MCFWFSYQSIKKLINKLELGGFDLLFKLVISLVLSVSKSHWFRPSYKPTTIVHVHRSPPFDGWIKLTVMEPARMIRTAPGIFPWGISWQDLQLDWLWNLGIRCLHLEVASQVVKHVLADDQGQGWPLCYFSKIGINLPRRDWRAEISPV